VERVAPELTASIHERVRVAGIVVLGCPLGNATFVTEFLDSRVEDIANDFAPCAQVDDGLAFYKLTRFCIASRLTFTLRTSFPQHSVRSAKSLDDHVFRAWGEYVGWDRSAVAPDATGEEVESWLRLGLFGKADDGWLGMPMLELATNAAFHSATVRWIAWLVGPKGPAMRRAVGRITNPNSAGMDSLHALKLAQEQLLADGAEERGEHPGVPGAVGVGALTLPLLHTIQETLRMAGPQLPGVAKSSPFPSQAQLYKLSVSSRGPQTRLLSPLPAQVRALAVHRERRVINMLAGADETDASSTVRELCKELEGVTISTSPMAIWGSIGRTPDSLRINREETQMLMCMMMGMEVRRCVAPPGGVAPSCLGCGKQVDRGGHHLMTCNKMAAYNAAHSLVQDAFSGFAHISNVTKVASTRKAGLPHEKLVGGRKSDLAVTVYNPPTSNPRLHARAGVSALCIDVTVTHPCTGKGILEPNKLVDVGKAKNFKHGGWHKTRGFGFVPVVCSTLGGVQNDTYRVLSLLSRLRAEAQDVAARAAAAGAAGGIPKSVEQRQGLIFARQRSVLLLTCLRGSALRLTGKHWDRGLTAGQRRAVAVRTLAELEEELAALVASGGSGDVVQAFR
jgi:hypothetical protein